MNHNFSPILKKGASPRSQKKVRGLIRYEEAKAFSFLRVDNYSVADDIGGIDPMSRFFFRLFVVHKANAAHLRAVRVKRKSRWGYGTFPLRERTDGVILLYV